MDLRHTRAMINAALDGRLDDAEVEVEPVFGLSIPTRVDGVPSEVLRPRDTWADPSAYDAQASKLSAMFKENFASFSDQVSEAIRAAGPR
jgi:phosphoenolpyruvate carboxykinase (ATP)